MTPPSIHRAIVRGVVILRIPFFLLHRVEVLKAEISFS
jgi:hypothetical protein